MIGMDWDHCRVVNDSLTGARPVDTKALESLEVLEDCILEPSLAEAASGSHWQFERLGYFCVDPDSTPERPIWNRTVSLRDEWARMQKRAK